MVVPRVRYQINGIIPTPLDDSMGGLKSVEPWEGGNS